MSNRIFSFFPSHLIFKKKYVIIIIMKKEIIITKIIVYFWYYILRPFRKVYNLLIRHQYIIDNPRNHQILEYCFKLMLNNSYQPSNPVESWLDMTWEKEFKRLQKIYDIEDIYYEDYRIKIAM